MKANKLLTISNFNISLVILILFVLYRVFVIASISHERVLPIEVDDSYVYISQAYKFYNDYERNDLSANSVISITKKTLESDDSMHIQDVSRFNHIAKWQGYYLYSATFGYFTEVLNIDPIKVWWSFSYITQIIVGISIILMINLFAGLERKQLIVASIISIFISLEVVHQITATPLTIANAILLIGWFFLNKTRQINYSWLAGAILIPISLHIHPGTFVVLGLLSFSSLVFWYANFDNKGHHINVFLSAILLVLLSIIVESLAYHIYDVDRYLSIIGYKTLAAIRHNLSVLQLVYYNFYETLSRLNDFAILYSLKGVGLILYFYSLYIAYSVNKKVFVINIIFLLGNIVGLLHYLPYHKGELIEYVGQTQLIFMAISFSFLYLKIIKIIKNSNVRNVLVVFVVCFCSYFFYNKYQETTNQIESRSARHNFPNDIPMIVEFIQSMPINSSIIIGDEFTYVMVLSEISDRYILLADHMRRDDKIWVAPEDMPLPSGYVGTPRKVVTFAGKKYKLVTLGSSDRIVTAKIKY